MPFPSSTAPSSRTCASACPTATRRSGACTATTTWAWPWPTRWPASSSAAPARSNAPDRKSTRLNSSHSQISYAVFCLKKKKKKRTHADQKTLNQLMNTAQRPVFRLLLVFHDEQPAYLQHKSLACKLHTVVV